MNRKFLLYTLFAFTFVFACGRAFSQTTENQVVKTERAVGSFNAISAKNGINLVLENKNDNNVVVEGDGKTSKGIELKLLNGILNISTKKRASDVKGGDTPKVYVPAKGIKRISATGGADIYHSDTIEAETLHLLTSGSSSMILDVCAKEVFLTATGSGDVKLTGNVQVLNVNSAGSCDVDCRQLKAKNVVVVSSGSSDVYVNAEETIDIKAMGASDIYYSGRPEVKRLQVFGAADVKRR